jgi:hypothetical protein
MADTEPTGSLVAVVTAMRADEGIDGTGFRDLWGVRTTPPQFRGRLTGNIILREWVVNPVFPGFTEQETHGRSAHSQAAWGSDAPVHVTGQCLEVDGGLCRV